MVLLTGDIHGETFRIADAVQRFELTTDDVIVILGDVGMNYYGNKKGDSHRKKRLNSAGATIFCVHGNHEMRPSTIDTYHGVNWHGGSVYVEDEYPNLLFAKDGEVVATMSSDELKKRKKIPFSQWRRALLVIQFCLNLGQSILKIMRRKG